MATEGERPYISVIEPLSPAMERVKLILFNPFQIEKWLGLGFCAWLAFLGSANGTGRASPPIGGDFSPQGGLQIQEGFNEIKDWVMSNLDWLVPMGFALGFVALGIWLVLLWLSSRGRFMFLDGVAWNRGNVVQPWKDFREEGNSLFIFRLLLTIILFVLLLPFLGGIGWQVFGMIAEKQATTPQIVSVVLLGLTIFVLAIGGTVVARLTADFVVPIMYLDRVSWRVAWREFRAVLWEHLWMIALYLLFLVALKFAIAVAVLIVVLITCCLAGCLLAIPYIGTVLLLPILVFERSYSALFLAQFGERYNVFQSDTPAQASPSDSLEPPEPSAPSDPT